jgi:hypothetical protein
MHFDNSINFTGFCCGDSLKHQTFFLICAYAREPTLKLATFPILKFLYNLFVKHATKFSYLPPALNPPPPNICSVRKKGLTSEMKRFNTKWRITFLHRDKCRWFFRTKGKSRDSSKYLNLPSLPQQALPVVNRLKKNNINLCLVIQK